MATLAIESGLNLFTAARQIAVPHPLAQSVSAKRQNSIADWPP
jgi:hypothetical protein